LGFEVDMLSLFLNPVPESPASFVILTARTSQRKRNP